MAVTISPEHRKLALPGLGQFCEDNQENLLSRNHEFQQKASGKVLEREVSHGDDVTLDGVKLHRYDEFKQKASGKVLEREISYGDDVKRH